MHLAQGCSCAGDLGLTKTPRHSLGPWGRGAGVGNEEALPWGSRCFTSRGGPGTQRAERGGGLCLPRWAGAPLVCVFRRPPLKSQAVDGALDQAALSAGVQGQGVSPSGVRGCTGQQGCGR